MSGLANIWSQLYPPKPEFTEKQCPDLTGKVYIVTGSNSGVGKELARILYSKNAKVYVAARSEERATAAMESMKQAAPDSKGELVYLHLDLADLTTIKATATEFLGKETKLHVLFHNAGVMMSPQGSKTPQGWELQLGVNNLGPFLLTHFLTPIIVATAKAEPADTVRVVWVSSSAAEFFSDKPGGVNLDNLNYTKHDASPSNKYGNSKAGNYLHATEFARRHRADGVVSVALNPGNLSTNLARYRSSLEQFIIRTFITHPPVFGAYTELFAGLSPQVTLEKSGEWIVPWGRFGPLRKDLVAASKPVSEGGTGAAEKWWQWCEEQVKPYF